MATIYLSLFRARRLGLSPGKIVLSTVSEYIPLRVAATVNSIGGRARTTLRQRLVDRRQPLGIGLSATAELNIAIGRQHRPQDLDCGRQVSVVQFLGQSSGLVIFRRLVPRYLAAAHARPFRRSRTTYTDDCRGQTEKSWKISPRFSSAGAASRKLADHLHSRPME